VIILSQANPPLLDLILDWAPIIVLVGLPAAWHYLDKRYATLRELNNMGKKVGDNQSKIEVLDDRTRTLVERASRLNERMEEQHQHTERHLIKPLQQIAKEMKETREAVIRLEERIDGGRKRDT
jgi:SMC interacting uncharacterized protein involved in chromosome segregation